MATEPNNTNNVSVGKGVKGGYAYRAPLTATLPDSPDWEPTDEWINLGFISSDGITNSISMDNSDYDDLNGDVVESATSSRSETYGYTLIEQKADVLREVYGQGNVTDEDGVIMVKHNSDEHEAGAYAFRLLLKNGRKAVRVIPNGKVTEVGDETIASSDLVARPITLKALPDDQGNTAYQYIESTETTKED